MCVRKKELARVMGNSNVIRNPFVGALVLKLTGVISKTFTILPNYIFAM